MAQELKDKIIPRDKHGKLLDQSNIVNWSNTFGDVSIEKQEIQHKITLARNIGYLSLMCIIWAEEQMFYQNRSELSKCLVKIILRDYEKKNEIEIGSDMQDILDTYHEELLKFGKLASLRKNGKPCNMFSTVDINKIVGAKAFMYGFLQRPPKIGHFQKEACNFTIHCLKEWFNAFYLCHNKEAMHSFQDDILANNQWIHEKSLIRLLIHMDPATAILPIIFIMKKEKDDKHKQYIPRAVQTLIEYYMNDCDNKDFRLLVKAIVKENQEAEKIKLCGPAVHNNGEKIAIFIEEVKCCTTLDLKYCFLTGNDLCWIKQSLQSAKLPIRQLILSYNNFKGFGKQIGQVVETLTCCQEYYLSNCDLTNQDIKEINESLQKIPSERKIMVFGLRYACAGESSRNYLDLVRNLPNLEILQCPVMKHEDLTEFIQNMISTTRAEKIHTLDLTFSNVNSQHIQHLPKFEKLKKLNMTQCYIKDEGLRKLVEVFEHPYALVHLESLILCINGLTDADLAVKLIRYLPVSVKEIDIGANDKLGIGLKVLIHAKENYFQAKCLQRIGFQKTGMNKEEMLGLQKEMKAIGIECDWDYLEMKNVPIDIDDKTVIDNMTIENIHLENSNVGSSSVAKGSFVLFYFDAVQYYKLIHNLDMDTITKTCHILP